MRTAMRDAPRETSLFPAFLQFLSFVPEMEPPSELHAMSPGAAVHVAKHTSHTHTTDPQQKKRLAPRVHDLFNRLPHARGKTNANVFSWGLSNATVQKNWSSTRPGDGISQCRAEHTGCACPCREADTTMCTTGVHTHTCNQPRVPAESPKQTNTHDALTHATAPKENKSEACIHKKQHL
jgi:hypothetical protein